MSIADAAELPEIACEAWLNAVAASLELGDFEPARRDLASAERIADTLRLRALGWRVLVARAALHGDIEHGAVLCLRPLRRAGSQMRIEGSWDVGGRPGVALRDTDGDGVPIPTRPPTSTATAGSTVSTCGSPSAGSDMRPARAGGTGRGGARRRRSTPESRPTRAGRVAVC